MDLNGNVYNSDKAARELFLACRDEFDGMSDIYNRADYLQMLYDERGIAGFMSFFMTSDNDYIALHKALVTV